MKKNVSSVIILLIIITVMLPAACRKKQKNRGTTDPINLITDWWMGEPPNIAADTNTEIKLPKYVKDYMLFNVGTYWVYKEKNTGAIDSVWVTQAPIDQSFSTGQADRYGKQKYEYLECYVKSSYYNCYYTYTCSAGQSEFPKGNFYHKIKRYKRDANNIDINLDDSPTCLILPYSKYKKVYHIPKLNPIGIGDSIIDLQFYEIINIQSIQFNNCVLVKDSKNYNENEATQYYFSKNIGLVKLEYLTSNKVWELVKYNIVQ
jgi:hypothetical protein